MNQLNTKQRQQQQQQSHEQGLNRLYLLTIIRPKRIPRLQVRFQQRREGNEQSKANQMINDNTKTQLAYGL